MKWFLIRISLWQGVMSPDYPQTWWLYYKVFWWLPRPMRFWGDRLWQRFCGRFVGHEISRTEKGYGGGPYEDRHCRWCDKVFQVPLGEFAREWGGELLKKESCQTH